MARMQLREALAASQAERNARARDVMHLEEKLRDADRQIREMQQGWQDQTRDLKEKLRDAERARDVAQELASERLDVSGLKDTVLGAFNVEMRAVAKEQRFRAEQAEQRVAGLQDLIRRMRDAKEQKGRARERHDRRGIAWAALRDEIKAALAPPQPAP